MRRLIAGLALAALAGCGGAHAATSGPTAAPAPPPTQAPVAAPSSPSCSQQLTTWLTTSLVSDTGGTDTMGGWLSQMMSSVSTGDITGASTIATTLVQGDAPPFPTCADPEGLFGSTSSSTGLIADANNVGIQPGVTLTTVSKDYAALQAEVNQNAPGVKL